MEITLVGMGSALPQTLTQEAREVLLSADGIVGAARLLRQLPGGCTENRVEAIQAKAILALLQSGRWQRPAVVFSGDTGFYSGAQSLSTLLAEAGLAFRILPGVSSVQLLAARLHRPWQGWTLVSAHGRACDAVAEVMRGRPTFFLTGGALTPAALCAQLAEAGLGGLPVTVGENLGTPQERITEGTAADMAGQCFAPLSVLLAEPPRCPQRRTPGWPDSCFVREDGVPMTKRLVRAAILSLLAPMPGETVWDVGAGTGSVSMELAAAVQGAPVYAVECKPQAVELLRRNREALAAWNVRIVQGRAPEALADLPAPDAVFIGGSTGDMAGIVAAALGKNPRVRLCASAIAPETVAAALGVMQAHGLSPQLAQLAVSTSKPAAGLHLMLAQNPVTLVYAAGGTEENA